MKKLLSTFVKYILFPAFGLVIIWLLYKDQKADEILTALRNDVSYKWLLLSMALGVLSHLSRAMRWQMLIEPVEKRPRLNTTFWAVMTGYLANLVFPRMGEVSRCGVLSKYEGLSFTKVVGTVVAERIIDLITLLVVITSILLLQFDLIMRFAKKNLNFDGILSLLQSPFFYMGIIGAIIVLVILVKLSGQMRMMKRVRELWAKFAEGLGSFRKVKNKPLFIAHTLFIWTMYFLMIYVCFFSMPESSVIPIDAGFTILVTGSLGMVAPVQGGIGPWHFMVIATLKLYGMNASAASLFALVVHAAQTLMIVVVGLLAFIVLPLTSRKNER